jgi:CheY-like chemotaxis protein
LKRKPLGQLLVQRGVLPPVRLREALDAQQRSGNRIGTECHARRFVSEEDLLAVLSDQVGVPGVHISNAVIPLAILDILPEAVALKQLVLPIRMDADRLFLAMADPLDSGLISEVAFISNRQIVVGVALQGLLRQAITDAYAAKRRGELEYHGEHAEEVDAQVPVSFVYPRELGKVPQQLTHPPAGPIRSKSSEEIVIQVDGGSEAEDFVVQIEDDAELSTSIPDPLGTTAPSAPPAEAGPPDRARLSALTVLVVDDDPELRRLMVRVLQSKGLEVQEAGRGLEALTRIKSAPPDLILLDAMLPEIHGFDICRKIKASERYGQIPIVMISSVYRGWRFARDLKDTYGVEAFIEKPFTIDVFWNTVERVLISRRRYSKNNRQSLQKAEDCLQHAIRCYRAGDLESAIDACRDGIKADPLSAKLHYRLGLFFLKKSGMVYQALQELEEAVTLDPELFSAQRTLAILYQRKGFKNKAIDMWERALRASPSDEVREQIRNHLKTLL